MSAALVDSMAADFEPEQFTDDYQIQLRQLIEAKLEQGESLDTEATFGAPAAEPGTGEVIDLMEALKRSIERKRGAAAGDSGADGADGGAKPRPAGPKSPGPLLPPRQRPRLRRAPRPSPLPGCLRRCLRRCRTAPNGREGRRQDHSCENHRCQGHRVQNPCREDSGRQNGAQGA